MDRTVSFFLYWVDKYMNDETGSKVGRDWDKVAKDYKKREHFMDLLTPRSWYSNK